MEECKGCLSESTCIFVDNYEKHAIGKCPCRICLIKGVCREACSDYTTPWQSQGEPYKSCHLNKEWVSTWQMS